MGCSGYSEGAEAENRLMPRKYKYKISEGRQSAINRRNASKTKQIRAFSPKAPAYAVKLRFAK